MVLDTFNIKSLRDALECDLCSSLTYDENCNCIFCGEHNERLEHKLKKLDNCLIGYNYEGLTPNIIALFSMRDYLTNSNVADFFKNNSIEKHIVELELVIFSKIKAGEKLNVYEENNFMALIDNNILSPNEIPIEQIIKNNIVEKHYVSKNLFLKMIELLVKKMVKEINCGRLNNVGITIGDHESEVALGMASETKGIINPYRITLDAETINLLYNGMDDGYLTLFHELAHIKQYIDIMSNELNESIMNFIKDRIVVDFLYGQTDDEYYNINHDIISYEIDAEINGYKWLLIFMSNLGIKLNEEVINKINEQIEELKKLLDFKERNISMTPNINGDTMSIDDLFEIAVINNPKYLETYPVLQLEYIVDGNHVRSKTIEELQETLLNINDPKSREYLNQIIENKTTKFRI